jgi:hypothetical protein
MGIVSAIFGGGIEGAGKGISSVINSIKGRSPEDAAKLQEILGRHADLVTQVEAETEKANIAANVALNDNAGQNVRAETTSNDAFVRRARPAFLWMMTGGIAINITLPLLTDALGHKVAPLDLTSYMGLFSAAFLGYTVARSYEKKQDKA